MDYDGDENWDIHVVGVETGEDRNLTPTPELGEEIIAYGRANPNLALVSVDSLSTRQPDIYLLDLASGELTLVQKNDGAVGYVADNGLALRGRSGSQPKAVSISRSGTKTGADIDPHGQPRGSPGSVRIVLPEDHPF